jgi:hypothetical protein
MYDKNIHHRAGGKINEEPERMVEQNSLFRSCVKYKNKRSRQAYDPVGKNPFKQENPAYITLFQYGPSGLWT